MGQAASHSLRGTEASVHLDAIRAIAAMAVVYSHARVLLMASLGDEPVGLIHRLLYMGSGYGHSAVMVFFVLSGYLVGGSVMRAVDNGRWSWREYLIARGVRLYIVLLPALIVTVIVDRMTLGMVAGQTGDPDTALAVIGTSEMAANSGWVCLFGNALYLQQILVPTFGSNTALWSLSYEFWYYILFPLFWMPLKGHGRPAVKMLYVAGGVGLIFFIGRDMALLFLTWLLGVLVAQAQIRQNLRRMTALGIVALAAIPFVIVLGLIGLGRIGNMTVLQFAVAVSFAPFMYAILHLGQPSRGGFGARTAVLFANFSYTLYAVHLPMLVFCRAWLTYEGGWAPHPVSWLKVAGLCAACTLAAYLLSLATEARTGAVREWLRRRLLGGVTR